MKAKSFLPVLCVLIITASHAQNQRVIDSLEMILKTAKEDTNKINTLNTISKQLIAKGDFDKAKQFENNALSLSRKINFRKGEANAFNITGTIYWNLGNYAEAFKNYFASLKIREEIGDKKGIADSHYNIGNTFNYLGNYPEALKNYFASLKMREAIGDKKGIALSYNSIGTIYSHQGNYSEALKNFVASLKILEETGDKQGASTIYQNIGNNYNQQGNYPEALKNYFAALKICDEIGYKKGTSVSYNNIGVIYYVMGNYPQALINHFAALNIKKEIEDKDGMASCYINLGLANTKLKKFADAKKQFDDGLSLSKESGNKEWIKDCYASLAELDSTIGNWKEAYLHHKLYIVYRDSLVNEENTKKIVQTQMQYDFDKKESATKAQQEKKDGVIAATLQKQRVIKNAFIGGFAVVLFFSGVFFVQRNHISKEKKRSDELLLNILPVETAEELKQTGEAKARDFSEVTVLFTDFKDFTGMSEQLSAQELVNEINYCYSTFDNIITKHGIEKIKTMGDSYMCAGGLPVANKINAEGTVRAALEILDFMLNEKQKREAQGKTFFEIRIGLNTGSVVAGIVGIKKFAYDIWGDTVNIASRMESSGEAGKVNISGSTYQLVKDKFTCVHRGKIEAKNKGMIDMYFVENIL